MRKAKAEAWRFAGKLKVPPGCTLEMQREGMEIYSTCQREWPDPNTLSEEAEPYEGQILDIEVVLRLVGLTFAPALDPGEMHCFLSDKAGGIITSQICDADAGLDSTLSDIWQAHEIDGHSYNEIASQQGITREVVRQRLSKAARRLLTFW